MPALLATGAFAILLAACGAASTGSPRNTSPAPTAVAPSATATSATPTTPRPTKVPGGSDQTAVPEPSTFKTAWGTAWDGLPSGFPLPAGAEPAEPADPTADPTSGSFVVAGAAKAVADAAQKALETAGFSTEALTGPYEDGSLVIDSVGTNPACRVQTRVLPQGGSTTISILYGAACPWS